MLDTVAFRSIDLGCSTCRRLKASSWRVSVAARVAASRIWMMSSRRASLGSVPSSSSSTLQLIAVSRLLKSCAMPPASCPTASSFCDWWSWTARSAWSETSLTVPTHRTAFPISSRITLPRSRTVA